MAEIELNVMQRECLGPRIESEQVLIQRLGCWSTQRNNQQSLDSGASYRAFWQYTAPIRGMDIFDNKPFILNIQNIRNTP